MNSRFASHGPNESLRIHATPTGFTSPHDDILAHMLGQLHVESADDGLLHVEVPTTRKEEQSTLQDATHSTQDPTAEKVYDPFEGTPIGLLMTPTGPPDLMPQMENTSPAGPSSSRIGDCGSKLEQWKHLSQVLDLQNELARMHLEMEGVGIEGKATGKGRGRGKGKGKGDASWERNLGNLATEWKPQRRTTTDTIESDVHVGDEEGVDVTGNEGDMKKAKEERFSAIADEFESRKEAVQVIMNKLDHLSKALTQFHTLQAPEFEFSKTGSRQNSTTPDVTPPIRSKITPYVSSDAGPLNVPNVHRLRPVLSSIPSSRGSLSSAPQATLEPEALTTSLSRFRGTASGEPIFVNEMEPESQMHVMDSPDSIKNSVVLPL